MIQEVWKEACKKETFSDWCVFLLLWIPVKMSKVRRFKESSSVTSDPYNETKIILQIVNESNEFKYIHLLSPAINLALPNFGIPDGVKIYDQLSSIGSYGQILYHLLNGESKMNLRFISNFMDQRVFKKTNDAYIYNRTNHIILRNDYLGGTVYTEMIKFRDNHRDGQQQSTINVFKNPIHVNINTGLELNLMPFETMTIIFNKINK